jgi:putative sugar O-methyltransferase
MNFFEKNYHKIFPKTFAAYYKNNKNLKNIDSELKFLTDKFIDSKSYSLVSRFWHLLSIKNYDSLIKFGLKRYASTIATNYYTFIDVQDEWVDKAHLNIKGIDSINLDAQLFKKQNNFTYRESIFYNYLCLLLYYNLKKTNSFIFLENLKDDAYLGFDDPSITIEKFNITTDKLVSLLDYEKINKAFNFKKIKTVLEIGAGSGRTSEAIISINSNLSYVICDIIPTAYISYKRLKTAFPDKKISMLVDIESKEELQKSIELNDISFIFPHQLELLKKNFFDLTIAIDCLHEMDKSTIQYYFKLINKISPNFYLSIWKKTKVPNSKTFFKKSNRLDYEKGDYNLPSNWEKIFMEDLVFPSNYLSLGFKTNNDD